jgi:hypothetical protein
MTTLTLKKAITKAAACDTWLHTFPVFQKHVPLAVGMSQVLNIIYKSVDNRKFGFIWVRRQLRNRVRKPWYREMIDKQVPRCKLDGTEVEMGLDYFTGKPNSPTLTVKFDTKEDCDAFIDNPVIELKVIRVE